MCNGKKEFKIKRGQIKKTYDDEDGGDESDHGGDDNGVGGGDDNGDGGGDDNGDNDGGMKMVVAISVAMMKMP